MAIEYPATFEVSCNGTSGTQTAYEAKAENFPPIGCVIPTKFNGPGGNYSPEELLAIAVISCFIASFKVFAEMTKLAYTEIGGTATLTADKGPKGGPVFTKVEVNITLSGIEDKDKAQNLCKQAEGFCPVSNAISIEKVFNYVIE